MKGKSKAKKQVKHTQGEKCDGKRSLRRQNRLNVDTATSSYTKYPNREQNEPKCAPHQEKYNEIRMAAMYDADSEDNDSSGTESSSSFDSLCSFCAKNCGDNKFCRLKQARLNQDNQSHKAEVKTKILSAQNLEHNNISGQGRGTNVIKPSGKSSKSRLHKGDIVWAPWESKMWPAIIQEDEEESSLVCVQYITMNEGLSSLHKFQLKMVKPFFCDEFQKYRYANHKVYGYQFDKALQRAYNMAIKDHQCGSLENNYSPSKHSLNDVNHEHRNTLESKVSLAFLQLAKSDGAKKHFEDLMFSRIITPLTVRFQQLGRSSVGRGLKVFYLKYEILTCDDKRSLLEFMMYEIALPHKDRLQSPLGDYFEFLFEVLYPESLAYGMKILFGLSSEDAYELLFNGFTSPEQQIMLYETALKHACNG